VARRATWVWDRPAPDDLLAWVRARGVQDVFLAVGRELGSGDLTWLRTVVELLRGQGVQVAALGGDTSWIHNPESALAWQREVVGPRLFDGIHLDIELWDRNDWPNIPPADVAAYLALLRNLAAACPLHLEADIAFHMHLVPTASGDSLETAVMRLVHAVTVLSFRNTVAGADSITDVAGSALHSAASVGIPCRLAVETKYLGPAPVSRKQTFHGLGERALNDALSRVDGLLGDNPTYAGMAVHDYEHWVKL
jgi:hypothetical protein